MVERQAAALALFDSPHEKAAEMLNSVPEIKSDIEAGRVSWETVCNDAPKP
jgi:hypothetical protein